jgi:hypothetical protein
MASVASQLMAPDVDSISVYDVVIATGTTRGYALVSWKSFRWTISFL